MSQWYTASRGCENNPIYEPPLSLRVCAPFDLRVYTDTVMLHDFCFAVHLKSDDEGWEYAPSFEAKEGRWGPRPVVARRQSRDPFSISKTPQHPVVVLQCPMTYD